MNRYRDDKSIAPMPDLVISKTRKPSSSGIIFVTIAICLVVVSGTLFCLGSPFQSPPHVSTPWNGNDWAEEPEAPFEPLKRYSLKYGNVACWQNNGVWIKNLSPVEMSTIGLDRFQDTDRAFNERDEEEFCLKLRTYGASFWSLPPKWPENVNWCEELDFCVKPDLQVNITLAYPETGGVWFLDGSKGWDSYYPQSLGLKNALTMEERSAVIKDLGGKFCENMQACPETAALIEPLPSNGDED